MNSRLLGILCMLGGAAVIIGALVWGEFANTPGIIAGILWALGSIAGLVGLIQLGALGDSPLSRALGLVPIIGFGLLAVGSVLQLAGIVDDQSTFFGVGWVVQMAGMLLVGILTIAARRWRGWRRFVPLLTIVLVPVFFALSRLDIPAFAAVFYGAYVLLGYAVATAEPVPTSERAATA